MTARFDAPRAMAALLTALLTPADTLGGAYASGLLEAVLALLLVAGLMYLALRFTGARGLLLGRAKQLAIEESLRLDGKSALVVVRVEGRRLLLATHAQATPQLITELAPGQQVEETQLLVRPRSAAEALHDE